MTFEDLTIFDRNLIKDLALRTYLNRRGFNRYSALIDSTLSCIHNNGFDIEPRHGAAVHLDVNHLEKLLTPGTDYRGVSNVRSADELIKSIFEWIHTTGNGLVKNETREITWPKPKASWYIQHDTSKKPWQF